jgi:hypothetical protein
MSNSLLHAADAKMSEVANRIQRAKAMFFPSFPATVPKTCQSLVDTYSASSVGASVAGSSSASSEIEVQSVIKSVKSVPSEIEVTSSACILLPKSACLDAKGASSASKSSWSAATYLASTVTSSGSHALVNSTNSPAKTVSSVSTLKPVTNLVVSESCVGSTVPQKQQLTETKNPKSNCTAAVVGDVFSTEKDGTVM